MAEGLASETSTEAGYDMRRRSQSHLLHLFCKSIGCWGKSEGVRVMPANSLVSLEV